MSYPQQIWGRELCDDAKQGRRCCDDLCRTGGETLCGFDEYFYRDVCGDEDDAAEDSDFDTRQELSE